jgi:hypothetical protein
LQAEIDADMKNVLEYNTLYPMDALFSIYDSPKWNEVRHPLYAQQIILVSYSA